MKILFIAHENQLGGASRSLLGLIDGLKSDESYEIDVLIKRTKENKLSEQLKSRDISYMELPFFWSKTNSNRKILNLLKEFFNLIVAIIFSIKKRRVKYDVIHTNSSVLNIGFYISTIKKTKHILHVREFGDLDFNLKPTLPAYIYKKLTNGRKNKNIFISESIFKHYLSLFNNQGVVIYNGIDSYVAKRDIKVELCNILISGTIIKNKGHETAIRAVNLIIKRNSLNNVKLIIAGKGDESFIDELHSYIVANELENNINFIGYVEDMRKLRESIDIELVCSKAEAFGRVTVEAMIAGVVVVASNTGANKELVNDKETGLIYEYNSVEDLADKISLVINDSKLASKLSVAGMKHAKNKFSLSQTVLKVKEVYKDISNG